MQKSSEMMILPFPPLQTFSNDLTLCVFSYVGGGGGGGTGQAIRQLSDIASQLDCTHHFNKMFLPKTNAYSKLMD